MPPEYVELRLVSQHRGGGEDTFPAAPMPWFWDQPSQLEPVSGLKGPTDYGVYQVYGGHPVYGNSALLYIGVAAAQEFGKRIPQERHWLGNRDAGRAKVYVGRLAGNRTPDDEVWDLHIWLAERLLIPTCA